MFAEFPAIPQWFAVGSWAFWGLFAAWLIITFASMKKQNGIVATIAFGVFVLALQFMAGINLVGLITANWLYIIPIFVLWVVASAAWTFWRWRSYAHERTDFLNEKIREWKTKGRSLVEPNDISSFQHDAQQSYKYREEGRYEADKEQPIYEKLLISKNKARWGFWFTYAVFDAPVYILWDSVIHVGQMVLRNIGASLQSISDKIYNTKVEDQNVLK